ncbi:glycosyltransferase [Bryobacter aggregatus]|uniref:glycosyltransferase n=1 Tax=Bryobacter aggregatus TaxID=360054 RepID=UPI0004E129AF|nr:glycosyltransferase [Bryobacter aggregatus]
MNTGQALVVFSHLRWNCVYQRPQQILSRLARNRRVFFIEEPKEESSGIEARWDLSSPVSNVTVMVPRLPAGKFVPGFGHPKLKRMIRTGLAAAGCTKPIVWTDTPSAVRLLEEAKPAMTVYDCMDALHGLREQEEQLLHVADLVFAGGPSLFRAKRGRHPEVHCVPSSVDVAHFREGVRTQEEDAVQAKIPYPRFGYFGVIDERMEVDLIRGLAAARPDWQIVLVGPVVKIDPGILPQADNIHYMGQQDYHRLPSFVKGWNVCLMPCAMNEATKLLSPVQVLEYMAAGKPIVSTPIRDVVEPYGHVVHLADSPEEFLRACKSALADSYAQESIRILDGNQIVANTSWDQTVSFLEAHLHRKLKEKQEVAMPQRPEAAVLTSSVAGLSAA